MYFFSSPEYQAAKQGQEAAVEYTVCFLTNHGTIVVLGLGRVILLHAPPP